MTAHAFTDDDASPRPAVWDEQRLASLIADVGEVGLRDVLRLFMADLPHLRRNLAAAIAEGREEQALAVLAMVQDSAEALGLLALACLVRSLRETPLDPANPERLEAEANRIRFVPSLKQAS